MAAFALFDGRNHLTRRAWLPRAKALAVPPDLRSWRPVARWSDGRAGPPAGRSSVLPGCRGPGRTPWPRRPRSRATGKILGRAEVGDRRPVALAVADARQHLHVLGATGSGKSTLLTNLVLDDVAAGRGAVVIDPKGDLVNDIIDRLPTEVAGRVVVLDPDDAAHHRP